MWKDIAGYEGLYQVHTNGRVRSFSRKTRGGKNIITKHGKVLKQYCSHGYMCVSLYNLAGKERKFLVHRLLSQAFLENPQQKPFVNHLNGNRSDNRLENLEPCTHEENMSHASQTGLICKHLITPAEQTKLKQIISRFDMIKNAAKAIKVNRSTLYRISIIGSGSKKNIELIRQYIKTAA